jgi:transcriptional regulator with XRE-family HTH domain
MNYHAGILRSYYRQLRVLRDEAGLTQEVIARHMQVSSAKISRMFQSGRPVASWADLTMLLDLLGATDDQRAQIQKTWRTLKASSAAFAEYRDILSPSEIEYYEAVQHADVVWMNSAAGIPPILTVPRYHEAIMNSSCFSRHKTERWRELLPLIKQQHNPRRELNVMLDESVLLRWSVPGFHEQLDALLAAHEAGTCIQVVPLGSGNPIGLIQPFTILLWDQDPESTLVCIGWTHKPIDWVPDLAHSNQIRYDWHGLVASGTNPQLLPAIIELAHRQTEGRLATVIPS